MASSSSSSSLSLADAAVSGHRRLTRLGLSSVLLLLVTIAGSLDGALAVCSACALGQYCSVSTCTPCPLGSYCSGGATQQPVACSTSATTAATGGSVTASGSGYTLHTFTATGTFSLLAPVANGLVQVLVVGGGGGSGGALGGGGGGGGAVLNTSYALSAPSSTTATVGTGGAGQTGELWCCHCGCRCCCCGGGGEGSAWRNETRCRCCRSSQDTSAETPAVIACLAQSLAPVVVAVAAVIWSVVLVDVVAALEATAGALSLEEPAALGVMARAKRRCLETRVVGAAGAWAAVRTPPEVLRMAGRARRTRSEDSPHRHTEAVEGVAASVATPARRRRRRCSKHKRHFWGRKHGWRGRRWRRNGYNYNWRERRIWRGHCCVPGHDARWQVLPGEHRRPSWKSMPGWLRLQRWHERQGSVHLLSWLCKPGPWGHHMRWEYNLVQCNRVRRRERVRGRLQSTRGVYLRRGLRVAVNSNCGVQWHRRIMRRVHCWLLLRGQCVPTRCLHLYARLLFSRRCRHDLRGNGRVVRGLYGQQVMRRRRRPASRVLMHAGICVDERDIERVHDDDGDLFDMSRGLLVRGRHWTTRCVHMHERVLLGCGYRDVVRWYDGVVRDVYRGELMCRCCGPTIIVYMQCGVLFASRCRYDVRWHVSIVYIMLGWQFVLRQRHPASGVHVYCGVRLDRSGVERVHDDDRDVCNMSRW